MTTFAGHSTRCRLLTGRILTDMEDPQMVTELSFDVTSDAGAIVLRVDGEIDVLTAPALREKIASLTGSTAHSVLVLDLSDVTFLASAGLAVLAGASDACEGRGRFIVVAQTPVVLRPLELTGLTEAFEVFPTVETALATV